MSLPDAAWGLYVHVPWCRIRCPYCAFVVDADRGDVPWDAFAARIEHEVAALAPGFQGPPATVYVGGGTPSRLPVHHLARWLGAWSPAGEVTVEVNPEDLDADWLDAAQSAGVDRLSLGVQTLDPAQARRLGRAHTPAEARAAASLVAASDLRTWSADLMFALPGQTLADLDRDLDALLALDPPHVSVYGLTLEEGTPFRRAADAGRLRVPDEDLWRAMADRLLARLEQAGLDRYEVSNFARPGHESVHNQGYWQDRPYLGVGPSAHGYAPDGRRWVDTPDIASWVRGESPVRTWEQPTPAEAATERLLSGLRGRDGLDLGALAARTGHRPSPRTLRTLTDAGLLAADGDRIALQGEGWHLADAVTRALCRDLAPVDRPPRGG